MTVSPALTTDRTRAVVSAAERLLTKRTGATVTLTEPEDLGGSVRTAVLRVRPSHNPFSLPRTMVVKRALEAPEPPGGLFRDGESSEEAFLREIVSYQFATSLPSHQRPGATLVAHDAAEHIMVLDDLGAAPTLSEVLADADPVVSQRGLVAWAQALGRMHAATAGREGDFAALLRHSGRSAWIDPLTGPARSAFAELPGLLSQALGVRTPTAVLDEATRTEYLLTATRKRAFSPSDLCPDNAMMTSEGVKFLDFECAGFRDITLDAVYALVPFPSCWCGPAMTREQGEAVVQAWRSEVVGTWPEVGDDDVLQARLFDAQILWVWVSTWWFLPGHAARRDPSADHPLALSPAAALALRWARLAHAAEAAGSTATAEHALQVARALDPEPSA